MSLNNAHEGYDYQDLLTSYFILKEVLEGKIDSIFSIDKKNTACGIPDRFDDLVITNGTEIQRKQIKYSNEAISKTLKKDYLSSDSHYKIAIHKLFESWKDLKTPNTEFRLCLAWDDPTDDNIKSILELQSRKLSSFSSFPTKVFKINLDHLWEENPVNFNRWNSLSSYVKTNSIDRDEFNNFCNDLNIEVGLPKASLKFNRPHDLEKILIEQAKKLGIEQYPNDNIYIADFLVRLAKTAGTYRTNSTQISAKDVLSELRIRTDFGRIKQKFEVDQSKNIISDDKNSSFLKLVHANKKTLLIGEPGSGKSWFLTNFIEYLKNNDNVVIRHYCFTGTEDALLDKRVSSDVFFGNLISDIARQFPDLKTEKVQTYASNLKELNLLLSAVREPLLIIVDGLDHIDRVLKTSATLSEDKTRIIEYISQIDLPENIVIILGSQPVDEVKVLREKFGYIELQLPKWDTENTKELMEKFGCENIQINEQNLSDLLLAKSEGSPLYLTYILMTLSNHEKVTEELIENLPKYDFNLQNYYEYLTNQIDNNVTAEILSCLEFAVNKKELKEIIPVSHHFDSNIKLLSPVISENTSRGGIKLYHDSFRRFNLEKLGSSADLNDIYKYIIKWLNKNGFYKNDKSYRYLLSYLILSKQYKKANKFAKNSFLAKSLYYGHSESLIWNNYKSFLHIAKKSQNWSLFIYSSELHRAISTTSSEENHSQILDNFELYFEAICSIYGAEKANSLLFFNSEKNYSDRITARAFMILQKYGYSPYWKKVKELFRDSIEVGDVKYYVNYLVQEELDLDKGFISVLPEEHNKYFREYLLEIYKQKGFDEVLNLYKNLQANGDEVIARRINDVLGETDCSQKIPTTTIAKLDKHGVLDLSFIKDHSDKGSLGRFYLNVEHYASSDKEALSIFEQEIPSHNFVYNWIKYFIRLFLIEVEPFNSDTEKEKAIVENIKFLASDTSYYKGTPRAMDFTHYNGGLINHTIERSLRHISSKESWKDVISALIKIPLPTLPTIESQFLNEKNIHFVIDAYESFAKTNNENYSEYADYSFKKSIYYAKVGHKKKAKNELKKALRLITSYTFHKDRNLAEIIQPLSSVHKINHAFAKKYAKKLKYLTDAVMNHTDDNKGTRWLTIEWYEQLLIVDYHLAAKYLVHQLLTNEGFWKLDYMFVSYLQHNNAIDPIILNFLYKLSPTNSKENYLNGFLKVINNVKNVDRKLAELSLINLLTRELNHSSESLSKKTLGKIQYLKNEFKISIPINSGVAESTIDSFKKKELNEVLTKQLCKKASPKDKANSELIKHFEKLERLSEEDFNYLYFFIQQESNNKLAIELLMPIIRKRFPRDAEKHFKQINLLIDQLLLSNETKIFLFINNFVYSRDGWYSSFVDKESLKKAVEIDKVQSSKVLAATLHNIFVNSDFLSKSTANLIIAFEHAGLEDIDILSMYKRGFKYIQNRLPDDNDFKWKNVENSEISDMNDNEVAVVVILSKTKNLDAFIQKEVIVAINYLMKYDDALLIKPFRWFFNNIELFHQLSVASILELFLIEIDNHTSFLSSIKDELKMVFGIDNLYIHNTLEDILNGLEHE